MRREREQAARHVERRRETWLGEWLKGTSHWVAAEGLPELARLVLPVVREALQGFSPDDPPDVVADAVRHSVRHDFAAEFAQYRASVLRESRAHAAQSASQAARGESATVQQAVYAAARAAAGEVDPQTVAGWNLIDEAARLELSRLREESRSLERREAERRRHQERETEQARQNAERTAEQQRHQAEHHRAQDRVAREWAEVEREIPAVARGLLPSGYSEEELAFGEAAVRRALEKNRGATTPGTFRNGLRSLLAPLAIQVRERQRAEAKDELWRQTVSRGLSELNRLVPSGATDRERKVATDEVTMNLSMLQEGSSPAGAQTALSNILAKALLPIQRRLAIDCALSRVPASAGDALAIAAARAAAQALDGRSEAWRLDGLARDAVGRVIDRAERP